MSDFFENADKSLILAKMNTKFNDKLNGNQLLSVYQYLETRPAEEVTKEQAAASIGQLRAENGTQIMEKLQNQMMVDTASAEQLKDVMPLTYQMAKDEYRRLRTDANRSLAHGTMDKLLNDTFGKKRTAARRKLTEIETSRKRISTSQPEYRKAHFSELDEYNKEIEAQYKELWNSYRAAIKAKEDAGQTLTPEYRKLKLDFANLQLSMPDLMHPTGLLLTIRSADPALIDGKQFTSDFNSQEFSVDDIQKAKMKPSNRAWGRDSGYYSTDLDNPGWITEADRSKLEEHRTNLFRLDNEDHYIPTEEREAELKNAGKEEIEKAEEKKRLYETSFKAEAAHLENCLKDILPNLFGTFHLENGKLKENSANLVNLVKHFDELNIYYAHLQPYCFEAGVLLKSRYFKSLPKKERLELAEMTCHLEACKTMVGQIKVVADSYSKAYRDCTEFKGRNLDYNVFLNQVVEKISTKEMSDIKEDFLKQMGVEIKKDKE